MAAGDAGAILTGSTISPAIVEEPKRELVVVDYADQAKTDSAPVTEPTAAPRRSRIPSSSSGRSPRR